MIQPMRQETIWSTHDPEETPGTDREKKEEMNMDEHANEALTKMDEHTDEVLQKNDGCLDWDAEISGDLPEYVLLPEGDYQFRVAEMERGRHEDTDWMPACDQATVTLEIRTAEGTAYVKTAFYLHTRGMKKLTAFFRAIGFQKKGQPMKMDWPAVTGAWGRAHFRPRGYTGRDGQEHQQNDVAWFLDFDADKVIPGFIDVTGAEDDPF